MGDIDVDDLLNIRRPAAHDGDAVRQLHGLVDIVGDEDDGVSLFAPDAQQLAAHDQPRDGIERPERLVEQQHVGFDGEGPRHFETLLHSARQLRGVRLLEADQADHFDVVRDPA
jgi:hypothetical protein